MQFKYQRRQTLNLLPDMAARAAQMVASRLQLPLNAEQCVARTFRLFPKQRSAWGSHNLLKAVLSDNWFLRTVDLEAGRRKYNIFCPYLKSIRFRNPLTRGGAQRYTTICSVFSA